VREYVRSVLGQLGYIVLEAANGTAALEVARKYPGEISLLLSDIVMPQMNGPQLAHSLRRIRPHIKVLYMSGYTEPSIQGDLGRGEIMMQKPFSPTALANRLREVLES
jgi:CheY-like chemotaxis protein